MPIEVSQAELGSQMLVYVLLLALGIAIYFGLKSGDKYSEEDTQRDAVGFAGVISEAEGPLTTFLIIAFIILILWAVVYLVLYL
ncbi:Uncharacterised protein [uncultured archaeon]|nr:Uncharacterised protein [uncultured archaeon]